MTDNNFEQKIEAANLVTDDSFIEEIEAANLVTDDSFEQEIKATNSDNNAPITIALLASLGAAMVFTPLLSASAALGAAILPHLSSSLVGGYAMIAATGAVTGCFAAAIFVGFHAIVLPAIYHVLTKEQAEYIENFKKKNPELTSIADSLFTLGILAASAFIASVVMGQAFLPLLACLVVGLLVGILALGALGALVPKKEPIQSHGGILEQAPAEDDSLHSRPNR